jgi:hypothetical protein
VLQLALFAALILLCVVWFVRQANAEANPRVADFVHWMPRGDAYMLAAFAVLIVAIALTA